MGTNATVAVAHRWRDRVSRSAESRPGNPTPDRLVGRYVIGLAAIAALAITSSLAVDKR